MTRLPAPFGPFEPVRRLGAGGMAETFVAVRRGPGRFEQTVCIKRILPAHEDDQEFVTAFLDEARTSAALRHANIVQVLDFGVAEGSHYLALELIDGVDLRALLQRCGAPYTFSAELVALIALELASALGHAHGPDATRARVVHRDISPSNVLVSRAGEIKLTDFGIARAEHQTRRTKSGVLKGKVPYMAPEYIEDGVFDGRSDLFALGVLLYELYAGERPFDGHSDIDTVRRILAGSHAPLTPREGPLDAALCASVERLLARDPRDRFQSSEELIHTLPELATHRVRGKLAALVQAELGADPAVAPPAPSKPRPAEVISAGNAATELASTPPPSAGGGTERISASRSASARSDEPTRTAQRPSPARRVGLWSALAIALLAAFALAARAARSTPPPLPPPPESKPALATSATGDAHTTDAVPSPDAALDSVTALGSDASADAGSLTAQAPSPHEAPEPAPPAEPPSAEPPKDAQSQRREARLRVVVVPYGDVWIDGSEAGSAPVSVRLTRGVHRVAVGAGRPEVTVEVRAGSSEQLTFRRGADGALHRDGA